MAENEAELAYSAAIDIEGLVYSIKTRMSQGLFTSPNCCIFKTPTTLRGLNEKAYVPDAFSIGPFHHGHPKFKETEKIKSKYLQGLISRSPFPEEMLRILTNSVMELEKEARECYAGPIDYSPGEFVKILVIDGCFIIELLLKLAYVELREENDPIFSMACMPTFLFHDLMLLENQLPWMVLERLFKKIEGPTPPVVSLIKLLTIFFDVIYFAEPPCDYPRIRDTKHILDAFRKMLVSSIGGEKGQLDWTLLPSATTLIEAGLKIKRGKSSSILDIKFDNGVLEIPQLQTDETTESLFRNIISFEQCYPNCEPRFTSYAILLDNLVNTTKDMDILCKNKIIRNWLNPEDAVPFFNKLYYNAYVKEIYYQSLCKEVNIYCNRSWPKWRAILVRNYFNTPWAILSTTAAAILLILSFLQTWYTIYKK
ncbi:UPF0481 protein At3g47200-like [Castanea sativa]|uniref:UPF0481 protein At3g47200-like n=1 Tax=Castanea sativa TaxID=21020 RepID=UPI003F64C563